MDVGLNECLSSADLQGYAGGRVKLKEIERSIVPVLKKHDVVRASLFGSIVRAKAGKGSDIDVLVEFKGKKSLLDLVSLKLELEEKLRREVDLAEYSAVHPLSLIHI